MSVHYVPRPFADAAVCGLSLAHRSADWWRTSSTAAPGYLLRDDVDACPDCEGWVKLQQTT